MPKGLDFSRKGMKDTASYDKPQGQDGRDGDKDVEGKHCRCGQQGQRSCDEQNRCEQA